MTHIDIYCMTQTDGDRAALAQEVTALFTRVLGCAPQTVAIRFWELPAGRYAVGGELLHAFSNTGGKESLGHPYYPPATFEVRVGWHPRSQKVQGQIASALTGSITKILNIPAANIEIDFHALPSGTHYIGGLPIPSGL